MITQKSSMNDWFAEQKLPRKWRQSVTYLRNQNIYDSDDPISKEDGMRESVLKSVN